MAQRNHRNGEKPEEITNPVSDEDDEIIAQINSLEVDPGSVVTPMVLSLSSTPENISAIAISDSSEDNDQANDEIIAQINSLEVDPGSVVTPMVLYLSSTPENIRAIAISDSSEDNDQANDEIFIEINSLEVEFGSAVTPVLSSLSSTPENIRATAISDSSEDNDQASENQLNCAVLGEDDNEILSPLPGVNSLTSTSFMLRRSSGLNSSLFLPNNSSTPYKNDSSAGPNDPGSVNNKSHSSNPSTFE